jgi:hypothetical protein
VLVRGNNRLRWPNPCAQKAFPLPLYPCPEIKTILERTLVFHFAFPLGNGLLCRALPPIRAFAFDILKLAGSSSRFPGPLPRRFPRTIFFDRCFLRSFGWPVVCVSIFEKPSKIPPGGSGSPPLGHSADRLSALSRYDPGPNSWWYLDGSSVPVHALDHLLETRRCGKWVGGSIYWSPKVSFS